MAKKSLQNMAKEMTATLAIMEGREKGDIDSIINKTVTIRDYDFMKGEDGDYAVFIIDEDKENFFFGGMVLTQNLTDFDENDYHEEIVAKGLPTLFGKKKSKKGNNYTTVTFFPDTKK